jgi:serine/threonine-protein kinase
MRFVHSQHIVHADLLPANILFDRNFRGLIGRFRANGPNPVYGPQSSETGALLYPTPEQMNRDGRCTEKSDVFAFGLIGYEIIGLCAALPNGRAEPLPSIPDESGPDIQRVIPRCWSRIPSDRPSFADILADFETCGFAILPDADAEAIRRAVLAAL